MHDEKKTNGNGSSNGNGTFLKELGKSAATSAIAGVVLAVVTKGTTWIFPRLK